MGLGLELGLGLGLELGLGLGLVATDQYFSRFSYCSMSLHG